MQHTHICLPHIPYGRNQPSGGDQHQHPQPNAVTTQSCAGSSKPHLEHLEHFFQFPRRPLAAAFEQHWQSSCMDGNRWNG